MKKQLLLLACLVFTTFISAQKVDWIFSIQSNIVNYDIEDTFLKEYYPGFVSSGINNMPHGYFDIIRETKSKPGFEIGIKAKIKLFKHFYITSGVEGVFYQFDRVEWIVNQTTDTTYISTTFIPITSDNQLIINPLRSGGLGKAYSEDDPLKLAQELLLLRVPVNFGITNKSEKLFLYGGIWYAYLIDSQFEKEPKYDYKKGELFSQNFVGLNLGIQISMYKKLKFKLDYSSSSTNIYAPQYIVREAFGTIFLGEKGDLPKSKMSHAFSFGLAFEL